MRCELHGYHRPIPLRIVVHHIQPLAMGGADVPANRIATCDNGHMNVHRLLGDLIRSGVLRSGGTRKERACARQGFQAWLDAGKPGRPVYELEEHP